MLAYLKRQAQRLKQEVTALACAQRHPDTPWYARAVALTVVAYELSPIDLIPDFVPVLGLLDDLILLPLGIYLALKLIPERVMLVSAPATLRRDLYRGGEPESSSLCGSAGWALFSTICSSSPKTGA